MTTGEILTFVGIALTCCTAMLGLLITILGWFFTYRAQLTIQRKQIGNCSGIK